MPTQAIAGFVSQFYIRTAVGPPEVYTKIGEMKDVTISIQRDQIDVSSHSTAGWKENIAGLAQWSANASYIYVEGDVAQEVLYDAFINYAPLYFKFAPRGDATQSGQNIWVGWGIVTSWDISGPNNDAVMSNVQIQGQGALDRQASP